MENLTLNLKALENGQKLILSIDRYDVVMATKNRLRRNGFGTFTLKTENGKLTIEKIK